MKGFQRVDEKGSVVMGGGKQVPKRRTKGSQLRKRCQEVDERVPRVSMLSRILEVAADIASRHAEAVNQNDSASQLVSRQGIP